MISQELEELCTFIGKNLQHGFIQLARCQAATPVLFQEKNDGSVCLCVDYHGFNMVCVENMYLLVTQEGHVSPPSQGKDFYEIGPT